MEKKKIDAGFAFIMMLQFCLVTALAVGFYVNQERDNKEPKTIITQWELREYIEQVPDLDFTKWLNEDFYENYTLYIFWDETIQRRWCCKDGEYFWIYEVPCFLRHNSNNSEKDWVINLDIECDTGEWDFSSPSKSVNDDGSWHEGFKIDVEKKL